MATIGRLVAEIDADASGLQKGIKDATGAVTSAASDITQQAKNIAGAIGAYMSADLFVGFIKGSIDAAAELGKLSQQTGIAVESLSALNYAASLNGASIQDLDGALKGLANKMLEAQMGSGEAADVFKALGIAVTDATGSLRATDAVLMDMADAFRGMEDGAGKAALSQKLMEDAGVALIPVLNQGSDGIKTMAQEAERLGVVIDQQTAAQASAFNDNLKRLNATTTALGQTIGIALIPTLNQIADEFLTAMNGADDMKGSAESLKSVLSGLYATGVGVATTFNLVGTTLGGVAAAAVAVAERDFSRAKTIMSMLGDDLDGIAQRAADSINRVSNAVSAAPGAVAPAGGKKPPPRLESGGGAPKTPGAKPALGEVDPIGAWLQQREEAESKYWANRTQRIADSLLSERELLDVEFQRDMDRLNQAFLGQEEHQAAMDALILEYNERSVEMEAANRQARIDAEAQANAEIERLRLASLTNLEKFNAMSWQEQAKTVASAMTQALTSVSTNSKGMFEVQKAASIAQAIMDTYAGANRALKDYPAPYSYAVAAATTVAGMARVSAIRSQTFGGATAAAGGGGAGGVTATTGLANQATGGAAGGINQTITISGMSSGDIFSGDAVRTLIDKLIDAQRNGARIVLA